MKPIAYHYYDESVLREIQGVRIFRVESLDPTRILGVIFGKSQGVVRIAHKGKLDKITRLFIPIDSRLPWVPFAYRIGKRIIERLSPDVVMSTAPPFSDHLVGLKLKKYAGIPWVADFRDAFLDAFPPPTRFHRSLQQSLLSKVRDYADKIIVLTDIVRKRLDLPQGIVLENGYDPEDMMIEVKRTDNRFVISYAGGLVDREYAFFPLLEALKELDGVVLKMAGFLPAKVRDVLRDPNIRGKVEHLGHIPHREAIALMKASDLLWLTVNKGVQKEMVPLKFFEYVGVGKPILAVVSEGAELARYIKRFNLGIVVPPEMDRIKEAILTVKEGKFLIDEDSLRQAREYFNKVNQTERLSGILEELLR